MQATTKISFFPTSLVRTAHVLVSWRLLRLAAPLVLLLLLLVWSVLLNLWLGGAHGRDRGGVVLGPDFPAFYTGGLLLRQPDLHSMYDLDRQQALQNAILPGHSLSAYVNPPHYAFVAAPFSLLPYAWAFALWSSMMMIAFLAAVLLLRSRLPQLQTPMGGWVIALAVLSPPVYFALSAGQNTGLSLLLHVGILLALIQRRDVLAGVLIALGMYKPQLFVVLLPLLLLAGRWRVLVSFGIGASFLGILTLLFFGWNTIANWIMLLSSPAYQFEEVRQAAKMFSWQPVMLLLFGSTTVGKAIGWMCALAVLVGLCMIWRRGVGDLPLRYALTLLGIVLIGPHLPVYDLALLILPTLIIVDRLLQLPSSEYLGLRVSLLALFTLSLFAANVQLRPALIIVPLITLIAWQASRLAAASFPDPDVAISRS
jgi:hypothetical protein